jgi:hypothetical protein
MPLQCSVIPRGTAGAPSLLWRRISQSHRHLPISTLRIGGTTTAVATHATTTTLAVNEDASSTRRRNANVFAARNNHTVISSSHLWGANNARIWQSRRDFRSSSSSSASTNSNTAGSGSSNSNVQDLSKVPKRGKIQLDFFGEPVTFLGISKEDKTTNAMAAMDSFLLCVVSKGRTCTGGGDEGGLELKSAHASALCWAEALKFASVWNPVQRRRRKAPNPGGTAASADAGTGDDDRCAPMLAAVAVAPVLAQAGIAYVRHLDFLLAQTKPGAPGLPVLSMMGMAQSAVQELDNWKLNVRERLHLQGLDHLLSNQYPTALSVYMKILQSCPGDAFALSQAMDLCHVLGNRQLAMRYVPVCVCVFLFAPMQAALHI